MKVIIAGTRKGVLEDLLMAAIDDGPFEITELVSGGAKGVDSQAELWARTVNIPLTVFPAEWEKYGHQAGAKRNREMAEYADALILIWHGDSPGSRNMRETMKRAHKPIYEMITRYEAYLR